MRLLNCLFLVLTMFAVMTAPTSAQEISFWEEFALSSDRAATLEKLVPGSEDYFYFVSYTHLTLPTTPYV